MTDKTNPKLCAVILLCVTARVPDTALHSGTGDYGATGTLDTSSRYKTAMITVKLNYGVR